MGMTTSGNSSPNCFRTKRGGEYKFRRYEGCDWETTRLDDGEMPLSDGDYDDLAEYLNGICPDAIRGIMDQALRKENSATDETALLLKRAEELIEQNRSMPLKKIFDKLGCDHRRKLFVLLAMQRNSKFTVDCGIVSLAVCSDPAEADNKNA